MSSQTACARPRVTPPRPGATLGSGMELQLLLASAVAPSLLLMWYFHSRDHHPEPRSVVLTTFFLGVLIVFPVLLLAVPLNLLSAEIAEPHLRGVYHAFFVAAIPEELFKLVVVWRYCARHKAFDEPMDGLVYGAVASLGFATLENILYVAEGGLGLAIMRALTAVPSHAFWGVIMGYYVGQAKFGPPALRGRNLRLAFLVPMLLHGIYDAPVLALDQANEFAAMTRTQVPDVLLATLLISLGTVVVSGIWAVRASGTLRSAQLAGAPFHPATSVSVPAAPLPPPEKSTATGVFLLGFGGLLVCVGGFFLLGIYGAIAVENNPDFDNGGVLGTAVVIALLPLVLGLITFRAGLRRL